MSLFELRSDASAVAPPSAPAAVAGPRRATTSRDRRATPWPTLAVIAALAALALPLIAGVALVNGDAVWHLIWGRELVHGELGTFRLGPTPHPSLVALAALTAPLGDDASWLVTYILFGPLAFGWLAAAVFEVARRLSSRVAGFVALAILGTSVAILSLATAARYDIVFAALVLTAIALEMAHPRRGAAVLACLAAAGLVRPEAWLLAAAYWLWLAPRLSWRDRARTAALAAAGPLAWSLMDLLVMGDPLYSLHATGEASEVLYGQYTPWENLETAGRNVIWYLGAVPLVLLAPAGVLLVRDRPRVALPLLATLALTLCVFLVYLARGMASSERYLLVPACLFAILAAAAIDGGGKRTPARAAVGVFLAVILSLQLMQHAPVFGNVADRSASAAGFNDSAEALMALPGVRAAINDCPAISLPTGKMRHWFSYYTGRPPETFVSDGKGVTRPDLYIGPGNPVVAKMALTRPRFDDDASYRVPANVRTVARNADWVLYAAPGSACARGLF